MRYNIYENERTDHIEIQIVFPITSLLKLKLVLKIMESKRN